ncbi:MAG: TetR/AcrR family transcriptional regulator [Deltaproteobacteria bacterium]
MATRAAILDAAHDVFKSMGYYGCSISEITRRCGISTAAFYQYFKNKEQVFLELNDLIISRFSAKAESLPLSELDVASRLREVVHLLFHHCKENFAFHRVLGESELIDRVTIGYYESIARYYRSFIRQEAQRGNLRPLDPNMIAYGLIGICYFNSLDWGTAEENLLPDQIVDWMVDFTLNGISGSRPWPKPAGWDIHSLPEPQPLNSKNGEPVTKGEKTRQAIFNAAEKILGRNGVNRTNIAEITREAGVAQGTFYIHFDSKIDLVEGFVKYINYLLRRELQRYVCRTQDRREAERVGMLAFYRFLSRHRAIYRVVPEFEMIGREVGLWYYKKMAAGYAKGLEQGIERKEIRKLPETFLVRSMMGLTHFIGLKWIIWVNNPQARVPSQIFEDIMDFIFWGLKSTKE